MCSECIKECSGGTQFSPVDDAKPTYLLNIYAIAKAITFVSPSSLAVRVTA